MTDNAPSGTGLDAAAAAFEAILTRDDADTGDPDSTVTTANVPDEEAEAQQDDAEATTPDAEGNDPDESDADADSNGDEEADDATPLADDATITLKVGDKVETLTVRELNDQRMMRADYSRKTAAVAEERKHLDAAMRELTTERRQLAALLPALEARLADEAGPEPDWDALWRDDPIEAARLKHVRDQAQTVREAARIERDRLQRAADEHRQAQTNALERQEWGKLIDARPEWRDEARWRRDSQAIVTFAREVGFTPEELAAADRDHRITLILDLAAKQHLLAKAKPSPAKQRPDAPRPAAPAAKPALKPVSDVTRAKQRLAKQPGSRDAAAALFDRLI